MLRTLITINKSTYVALPICFCLLLMQDGLHGNAFADNSVEVEVTGSIKAYCANTVSTLPLHVGDITKAGASTLAFTVDCNAPFQYSMESANGAMRLADEPGAGEIPYRIRVRIPLMHGGEIDDTCTSASLRAGAVTCNFTDSGQRIAIGKVAEAHLSWTLPRQPIAHGFYKDKIIIQIRLQI